MAVPAILRSVLSTATRSRYIDSDSQRKKLGSSGAKPASTSFPSQSSAKKSTGTQVTRVVSTPAFFSITRCILSGADTGYRFLQDGSEQSLYNPYTSWAFPHKILTPSVLHSGTYWGVNPTVYVMYTGGTLCDPFGMGSFHLVVYDSSNCRFYLALSSERSTRLVGVAPLYRIVCIWTLFHYDALVSLGGLG
jgi:hypothetical protein